VPAVIVGRVLVQRLDQHVGVEYVDAHGHKRLVRPSGAARRAGGLFQERLDGVTVGADLHDAEVRRLRLRHRDRRDRDPRSPGQVLVDHLHGVHAVDVIGSADHDEVRPVFVEQAQRLVDRVCRSGLPAWSHPLLGRHRDHVIAGRATAPPGGRQMPVQAVALVLGEHADLADPAVDQVGQREIDQAVHAAEWNGRLGPLRGQRRQPPPGRARQDNAKNTLASHPRTPCRAPPRLVNDARRTAVRPS